MLSPPLPRHSPIGPLASVGWASAALAFFHAGYLVPGGWFMLGFPFALFALVRLPTTRTSFYVGLALGFGLYAPHLGFFWTLFGPAAAVLWLVLSFWLAVFLATAHALQRRLPSLSMVIALPVLWMGLEYFRSELYFLRFSWLTPAMAFSSPPSAPSLEPILDSMGSFGTGAMLALTAALTRWTPGHFRWSGPALLAALVGIGTLAPSRSSTSLGVVRTLPFAGAQIESTAESELIPVLDRLVKQHPQAALVVLPEYSLGGEPDGTLREWCRTSNRHLIVGGREPIEGGGFHNTAFVIDTNGVIVFRQAKSVPIQFFDDGRPATSQALWHSPWGRVGIAICYDLSYTRVIDRLVRAGAEALVIPTMDAVSWGQYQHALHARIAPLRAAEYGVPIARMASSGISQSVDATGKVLAAAPFSEDVEFLSGSLEIHGAGTLPVDRWLAPLAVFISGLLVIIAALPISFFPRLMASTAPSPQ
jgi:apolipoprotein N-acyltransferase